MEQEEEEETGRSIFRGQANLAGCYNSYTIASLLDGHDITGFTHTLASNLQEMM